MNVRTDVARRATIVALAFCLTGSVFAESQLSLKEGDVVVLAGGTNMVRLQQAGHFETMMTRAFADARPKFRDLAWEADTVFRQGSAIERWRADGFGKRDDQFKLVGATVIIAQFGMLESMKGEQGIDAFIQAYRRLLDGYEKSGARVVLVSPTPFEKPTSSLLPDVSEHNRALAAYVDATRQIAAERGLLFVDLFTDAKFGLTDNGMHITPESQSYIAEVLAQKLGVAPSSVDELSNLRAAVIEKHRLWCDYWRPANWKLLYGDDAKRQFTKATEGSVPFREEWTRLLPMIDEAEQRVWAIASGGTDPGLSRPKPEVLHGDDLANIDEELAAFNVANGLKVNLFASEVEGLTSPLAIRWDSSGRAYVTVTTTYPHVFPGDVPNDRIIVLEDTDHDGRADQSTLFADGLNIPTGIELGDGGVYVGQNSEILFLKDTDGDLRADVRRVILSGFGNGDSHQTINSFVWSPGGELFMGQGDGIESRVETPWGSADLFQSGFYRLRPRRLQLHSLLDDFMGPGNPWGVAFDDWGQIFSVDGAGGVTHLSLGQIPARRRRKLGRIGDPGGYCGITQLDGRHLPPSMHGWFATGDFKSNRVKCFSVAANGAGFDLTWEQPLLHSRHRNFRPVDVQMGPDGAVYVVDWYNPITCHQDDEYRHPDRDKAHGRIWRVSSSSPTVQPPNPASATIDEVLDALKSPERWTRDHARQELTQRDTNEVAVALKAWVQSLDPRDATYEHHLYEALAAYATIEVVESALLRRLLESKDPRGRAFASRITGRWQDRLDNPLELLTHRVEDENAQVRMEAVAAAAAVPSTQSITVVARAVDRPVDASLKYVFAQAVDHLRPHWEPALKRGELQFARSSHLVEILRQGGGKNLINDFRKLADSSDHDLETRTAAIATLFSVGSPEDINTYAMDENRFLQNGTYDAERHARVLSAAVEAVEARSLMPHGDVAEIFNHLLKHSHADLTMRIMTLAELWKVDQMEDQVLATARNESLPVRVRGAAFRASASMNVPGVRELLTGFAAAPHSLELRAEAIKALVRVDAGAAGQLAVDLFRGADGNAETFTLVLSAFLNQQDGAATLAAAISEHKLSADVAKSILQSLFSTGRSDQVLLAALNAAIGVSGRVPEFSEIYVREIAGHARNSGEVSRGAVLFRSLSCSTCHQLSGSGGTVGPDLTAVGTTLSPERIIEELLWPNRQIKEGFSTLQVLTVSGKVVHGYERRTRDSQQSGDVVLQELTSQKLITIPKDEIEEQQTTGSPMPAGLTSVLSESQLFDLIHYLSELGKIK